MKKLLYSVSTALLLLSCNTEDPSLEAEPGKGGNMITFVGRTFPETRTEIGVKDGNSYPVLWSSGDRIGIISPVETLFQNASATLNASDAGKNSGIFVLETETAVESSMDLIVYYPYSSYTTYGDGALHASVPMEQRQARPGDSSHTGKYTLAYDKTTIDPAAAAPGKSPSASFSLRHAVAYVRLVISSTEYAGYKLNGASLWCDGEAVSGDISVNVATGETRTETPRNYATVVVEEPQALSSAQELWLVTLPVNLTGKEVYVSVAMTDGTNKAYWHFSGLKWASSGGNPNNNQNDILGVWSNSSYHGYEASDHNVYQLYYRTSQGTWNDGGGRAAGMSVRCMQDTENR